MTDSIGVLAQSPAGLSPESGSVIAEQATEAAQRTASRLTALWEQSLDFLQTNGLEFGINLLVALVIFFAGKAVARLLSRIVVAMLERARLDPMLVRFSANLLYTLMLVVVGMAALEQLGVQTTSLTAILAAAGFAVGMALQGSLGNFAAGVMLITFRPFKTGDAVEAGGVSGDVEEIQIFNTIFKTADNRRVIVPNSSITGGVITNNSANPTRRIELVIGCSYLDDVSAVKSFLMELLETDPRILRQPAPVVAVNELAEYRVNFLVQPWVRSSDYGAVRCDLMERIKIGFDQQGFSFPFPSRDVYMHQTTSASAA